MTNLINKIVFSFSKHTFYIKLTSSASSSKKSRINYFLKNKQERERRAVLALICKQEIKIIMKMAKDKSKLKDLAPKKKEREREREGRKKNKSHAR